MLYDLLSLRFCVCRTPLLSCSLTLSILPPLQIPACSLLANLSESLQDLYPNLSDSKREAETRGSKYRDLNQGLFFSFSPVCSSPTGRASKQARIGNIVRRSLVNSIESGKFHQVRRIVSCIFFLV
ncbi:hypothetical protein H6P81_020448 [Aristolochia fimbriata]|uniref:Uncharacterized protein n=1 Tax=Aristolochia fimbriata TaxID=158543 RepID=A0AAV7DYU0_ARIFI|nr:hypothetical protein H6P81_020448 [Aristolochia fimbriata]